MHPVVEEGSTFCMCAYSSTVDVIRSSRLNFFVVRRVRRGEERCREDYQLERTEDGEWRMEKDSANTISSTNTLTSRNAV
jgi:hypothetical protein